MSNQDYWIFDDSAERPIVSMVVHQIIVVLQNYLIQE